MKYLITTDLHLSDRPRDGYRFGLFPWLFGQQQIHKPDATFILGDITQDKDKHPASLVNKIVSSLLMLKPPVYILKGNHDYIDIETPFFKFLNELKGVTFISDRNTCEDVCFIPHQPSQEAFDLACRWVEPQHTVMLHQTIQGAVSEANNTPLTGLRWPISGFNPKAVYSGDVHKPQLVGPVKYVGSPFHVRFGDQFVPRVLLVDGGRETDLYFPSPKKAVLRIRGDDELATQGLEKGDQVKIHLELAREEVVEWAKHKEQVLGVCKELGLEVFGLDLNIASNKPDRIKVTPDKSNTDHFKAFCNAERVPSQMRQVGNKLLGGGDGEGL